MTSFKSTKLETPVEIGREVSRRVEREIAAEVAVALSYNGVAHVVMFMSPLNLEDFAHGFSLTEGIIQHPSEILSLEIRETDTGMLAQVEVSPENFKKVLGRKRNLPGQSGCGICGVIELEEAMRELPLVKSDLTVARPAIFKALDALRGHQKLNAATHAVHGAAFVSSNGDIVAVREDIGRHNALDKLIGHLRREDLNVSDGFLVMTSRCSIELVQKAVIAGFALMVTISAPTGLALDFARKADLGLVCVARHDSMMIYHNPRKRVDC